MRILVVGLGSMGKRRVRNLLDNGLSKDEIIGFDLRVDRRNDAEERYDIKTVASIETVEMTELDAMIISVPPDIHKLYMDIAVDRGIPCFVEASVVDDGMDDLEKKIYEKGAVVCPSCTLRFHPAIKMIKKIINEGMIGHISNFSYHSGQYLPDWHPWENIKDFYVSNPPTGGGREIVPFELTWMNWIFGDIKNICGYYRKTIPLDAPIDDTYVSAIEYENGIIGTMVVDVVSRKAIRHLTINGENGQIVWDWDKKGFTVYSDGGTREIIVNDPEGHAAVGYNSNIVEEMYIEEIAHFLNTVKNGEMFPNTIEDDHKILRSLYALESTDERK